MIDFIGVSAAGAGLILTVLILKLIFRKKIPPMAWIVMWTLILLRLLFPFKFNIRTESYVSRGMQESTFTTGIITGIIDAIKALDVMKPIDALLNGSLPNIRDIWIVVAAILAAAVVVLYMKMLLGLKDISECDSRTIAALVQECRKAVGIRRKVRTYITDKFGGACVIGVIWPKLVLPVSFENDYSDEAKENIMLHEMQHIRYNDNAQKLLFLIAACLHWFNPLVWYALLSCRADAELFCDEAVVRRLPEGRIAGYGRTLIGVAAFTHRCLPAAVCSGMSIDRTGLRDRIKSISLFGRTRRKFMRIAVSAVLVLALAAFGSLTFFKCVDEPAGIRAVKSSVPANTGLAPYDAYLNKVSSQNLLLEALCRTTHKTLSTADAYTGIISIKMYVPNSKYGTVIKKYGQ